MTKVGVAQVLFFNIMLLFIYLFLRFSLQTVLKEHPVLVQSLLAWNSVFVKVELRVWDLSLSWFASCVPDWIRSVPVVQFGMLEARNATDQVNVQAAEYWKVCLLFVFFQILGPAQRVKQVCDQLELPNFGPCGHHTCCIGLFFSFWTLSKAFNVSEEIFFWLKTLKTRLLHSTCAHGLL